MTVMAGCGATLTVGPQGRRTTMTSTLRTGVLMPLLAEPHLWRALRACHRYAAEPGTDRVAWTQLYQEASSLLPRLAGQLADGVWKPGPTRFVEVASNACFHTKIVLPALDQLVHMTLRSAIEPVLDELAFDGWVSGSRPRHTRMNALRRAAAHTEAGHLYVADLHVASAAMGVTTDEVIGWIGAYIHDGVLLAHLRTALTAMPAPIMCGSSLAPVLINLRLSQVDKRLPSLRVVRVADNYAAFAPSSWLAQEAFYTVSDALLSQRLYPNETKSRIRVDANIEDLFLAGG